MTKLEAIEEEITKLSRREFAKLRDWIADRDWDEWDKQIERDSASGKLEKLFARSMAEHAEGKSRKL